MGARLCCAQKGATEDVHGPSDNRLEDGGGSGGFLYEDEEGADIFFSARLTLSQVVGELPYPPTATPKFGNVTVALPESMLLRRQQLQAKNDDDSDAIHKNDARQSSDATSGSAILKRPTEILTERLTEELMVGAGYPGELSKDELEACLEFRRRLKENTDPTYRAMVYMNVDTDVDGHNNDGATGNVAGRGPEEEAFALCRFLRARQFDVDKTFVMMDEHVDLFREALTNDDLHRSKTLLEEHIGCPLPVLTKQFPLVDYGIAKNGAFVVYIQGGKIRLFDGFDCIATAETPESFSERYMPMAWYTSCHDFCEVMHRLSKERQSIQKGADFVVLAEAVVVIDMEGLQRELFTKRTMAIMQEIFGVIQCFPEILNRVVVVNVPYFFTFIWTVLKHFIDARTIQKFGFFSNLSAAQNDLLELIDPSQLLVEYGGEKGNPSYEEALDMKLKRDGDYDRYIFERYSIKTKFPPGANSVTLKTFSLSKMEEAELTVYTQSNLDAADSTSKNGTRFSLLPEELPQKKTNASEGIKNGSKHNNDNGNKTILLSRFGQPAAISRGQSTVTGPGNFRLVVKESEGGPIIEKALLVISIR